MFRVGFAQTSPLRGDLKSNLDRAARLVYMMDQADLIVLPELFASGYLFDDRDCLAAAAEFDDGPTIKWAMEISRTIGAAVAGGFPWRSEGKIYNAAFLVHGDAILDIYAKTHLFDREKLVFDPGPGPLRIADVRGVKVGLMICYDWQFPEVARVLALKGAQILIHPSNLVLPWAQEAMKTRCLENGVFAVTCNRVGTEEDLKFTGRSQITGAHGEILARAQKDSVESRVVQIDPAQAFDKTITQRNHRFNDRRPELYKALLGD